jgi:VCBS repeat-containing protein
LTGVLTLSGEASHDAYEAAIRQIEFSTTQPIGTQKKIEVTLFDGQEWGPEAKAFITVGNDILGSTTAPVLDLDANDSNGVGADYTATFASGGPEIPVADTDVSVTDADSAAIESATITLAINREPEDVLSFTGPAGPITAAYDSAAGILTLTGSATLAEYQTALREVVFNTTSTSTADRIIEVTVNDGTFESNVGTTFMHVVANVPPALNLDADSSTIGGVDYLTAFTDGGPAVAIVDTDVLITDSDDTELTSATVTLTNPDTDDVLVFNGTPPLGITASLYDLGTGILTLTGTASLAAYQTALHQITFDNVGPTPSTDTRIIDVVVNDGTVASNLAQAIIHVAQVNNIAPVVDLDANDSTVVGTSFSATFTEGGAPIPIADIDTLITDTDSTTLASATITLTNPQAGDLLAADPVALPVGISASSYDPVTGILTLSGVASFADYETALEEAIRFSAAGENPVAGNRIIQVVVNDGIHDSQPATSLVTVVAVNDPPINTVPGGQTVAEDTTLSIAGVSVADSDSSALTTTLSVANGILNVTAGPGVTGDGTASVTIAGTAAEINAALVGLAYTGNLDFNGADTLTVATSDATATATDTIAITVNPVNDAPINSVPGAQSVDEDTILPIAGVLVADIDSSALTTTLSVAHGTLTAGPGAATAPPA